MRKTLIWTVALVLFEVIVSTVVMQYFDVVGFAEKHNEEIVHGVFAGIILWLIYRAYRKYRFIEKKNLITVQLLEE